MKAKNIRTGYKGEAEVKKALEAQGYIVTYPIGNHSGDLLVTCPDTGNTFKVEVKASNRNQNGGFKFCLYKKGKTDCRHADVIALVFYDKNSTEIRFVDTLLVCDVQTIGFRTMPKKYTGKYKKLWHSDFSQVSFLF